MSKTIEEVKLRLFPQLLRLSGFDPQTHDLTQELRTGFTGPVSNLITDLASNKTPSEKLRRLGEVSSVISAHFNKQGFYQPNGPATPEIVEEVLRNHLSRHCQIPANLKLASK